MPAHIQRKAGPPGNTRNYNPSEERFELLRADYEFLASACSNALFGDDRYRDMSRGRFLNAVRNKLAPTEPEQLTQQKELL